MSNPRIIDYATDFQSDFMDLYLSARCTFFIGNNGGMVTLPLIFRKPLVIVNVFIVDGSPPYDKYGFLERFPTHLEFTEEEEEFGRRQTAKSNSNGNNPRKK